MAAPLRTLIVGATGGLGKCLVKEALDQGHTVSVLVRDEKKLHEEVGAETVKKLASVHIGDGSDAKAVATAVKNQDVVISGVGARPQIAQTVAEQAKAHGVKKFVWVAGASNVKGEDGVTDHWKELKPTLGDWIEGAYKVHGASIDSIVKTGINYSVFCPGKMDPLGKKSANIPASLNIRINRPSGPFVSYEDAAWVMVRAASIPDWDRQHITASTTKN